MFQTGVANREAHSAPWWPNCPKSTLKMWLKEVSFRFLLFLNFQSSSVINPNAERPSWALPIININVALEMMILDFHACTDVIYVKK